MGAGGATAGERLGPGTVMPTSRQARTRCFKRRYSRSRPAVSTKRPERRSIQSPANSAQRASRPSSSTLPLCTKKEIPKRSTRMGTSRCARRQCSRSTTMSMSVRFLTGVRVREFFADDDDRHPKSPRDDGRSPWAPPGDTPQRNKRRSWPSSSSAFPRERRVAINDAAAPKWAEALPSWATAVPVFTAASLLR